MKIPDIEKFSWGHAIIRPFLDFYHDWIFNQRVYKLGKENLPKEGPLLVTFSHQCALMDSMVMLSVSNWQPVHIARADIFKPKFQRKLLFFFKMMPVFRTRDGLKNVKETLETFDKASDVFRKKKFVIIAPEANHRPKRRIRTLSKGFARMAFKAEEDNDFKLGLRILPVGIHYEDYYSARISVVVNIGKPIEFKDLHELYKQDEQKALIALRDRVAEEMKKLIIHIEDLDIYDECELIREVGTDVLAKKKKKRIWNEKDRFIIGKEVVDILRDKVKKQKPELFSQMVDKAREYKTLLDKENLCDFIVAKDSSLFKLIIKTVWFIATLPVFLYGALFNLPVYYTPKIMTRNIKDESFHTSVRFVFYLVLYPLYYLILFLVSGYFIDNIWMRLLFTVSLPLAGMFSISYARGLKKLYKKFKFHFSPFKEKLKKLRQDLYSMLEQVL